MRLFKIKPMRCSNFIIGNNSYSQINISFLMSIKAGNKVAIRLSKLNKEDTKSGK